MAEQFGITFSGGGFRATLFHLGVVRALRDAQRLADVSYVASVSGGSVLAAHLVLNWERYNDERMFRNAENELLDFVRSDVRGRVVRRQLLALGFRRFSIWIVRLLAAIFRSPRLRRLARGRIRSTQFLQRQYAGLFRAMSTAAHSEREALLRDLLGDGRPQIEMYATSLGSGRPFAFHGRGFHWRDGLEVDRLVDAPNLPVAMAVAASSAFPPLFAPVGIGPRDVPNKQQFTENHELTDGGVYDNLGVGRLFAAHSERALSTFLISDAGAQFEWRPGQKFDGFGGRNVRASELMMERAAQLQNADLDALGGSPRLIRVNIGDTVPLGAQTKPWPDYIQWELKRIRTDLDRFSEREIECLCHHGYSVAAQAMRAAGFANVPECAAPPEIDELGFQNIKRGNNLRWGLWCWSDWAAYALWLKAAIVVALFGAFAGWMAIQQVQSLSLETDAWIERSRQWLREPSGIAAVPRPGYPFSDMRGWPLVAPRFFAAIDDENSGLFLVQVLPSEARVRGSLGASDVSVGVRKQFEFLLEDAPQDWEGLAYDADEQHFVAVASHRLARNPAGKDEKGRRTRHLVQFSLTPEWPQRENEVINVKRDIDLDSLEVGLSSYLVERFSNIDIDAWRSGREGKRYEVEIEGLAYRHPNVWLGLKKPLDDQNRALVLQFDLENRQFIGEPMSLELGGLGISALTYVGEDLYIAANPVEHENEDKCGSGTYGKSQLYVLTEEGGERHLREVCTDVAYDCGKLEGLAAFDGNLLLAYDGDEPAFKMLPLPLPDYSLSDSACTTGAKEP